MPADFLQDDDWLSELTQDTRGVLKLRHDIMEHICRFLSPQDLMQLCQVSPTWSLAAKAILWEAPVFKNPESLKLFVSSAFPRKSLALQVKHLSLCLRDEEYSTVFRPVLDSLLFRHTQENLLWTTSLITQLARQCENIETLKIYGWKLKPMHIEQIGATLTRLRSLTVIGSNQSFQETFVLRNTVSKLHELRLDGRFVLSSPLVSTLATRAPLLRSLHVPIKGMAREDMTALCSGTLNLTHLTMTYASPMSDGVVQEVLNHFVNLKSFTLHGTELVTANVITMAISKCRRLESLELRAEAKSLQRHTSTDWSTMTASTSTSMRKLVIENMIVPDSVMYDFAQSCNTLTTLGLNNCRDISNSAMESLLYANKNLRLLHVVQCPGISDQTLDTLGKSDARRTIQSIHFESSGDISPQAVHQLCCATAEYTLQHMRLVDYPNIAQSDIGSYATERDVNDGNTKPIITLDERAIDAIATASRYDFAPLPKNRYLTGEQLIRLAKELDVSVEELEDAIERVQVDTELDEDDEIAENGTKGQIEPEQASASPEFVYSGADHYRKPMTRMSSLKNPHRPTTPAIWAAHGNDSDIQQYLPQSSTVENSPAPRYSRLSQHVALIPEEEPEPEPVPEPIDEFEELNESRSESPGSMEEEEPAPAAQYMEEEPAPAAQEDWPSLSGSSLVGKKGSSEVELGGWGVHNTNAWSKKVMPSKPEVAPRKQAEQPWIPYTAERHEHQWQQKTLEPQPSPAPRGGRNQRTSFVMQNDGWGQPKTHIAWDDLRHQGFAHEVLEQQKQTAFWDTAAQQWTVPSKSESTPAPKGQSKLASVAWPSIAETKTAGKRSQTNTTKQPSKRAPEPLSDDEENINWDVDDGVTIKTSPSLGPQYRQTGPAKGLAKNSSESTRSTKAASTAADKQRNDEGGSAQWRDFAALTVEEQVARSFTANARADAQLDLLVDTSDVVNGKKESLEQRPSTRRSFDSSIWKDVETLTSDNSPPQDQDEKSQFNDLVDTSDLIMSPTTEVSAPSMQEPLVPQVSKTPTSVLEASTSTRSSIRETPEPEINHDIRSVVVSETPEPEINHDIQSIVVSETPELEINHDIQSVVVSETSQAISDDRTVIAGESTLEMDLLGSSTPRSEATPPPSSEGSTTTAKQSGPGRRVATFDFDFPDKKLPPLCCYENIAITESARQFCEENNIPELYENILRNIRPSYNDRRTRLILNNSQRKKKKKRAQNQQSPPSS